MPLTSLPTRDRVLRFSGDLRRPSAVRLIVATLLLGFAVSARSVVHGDTVDVWIGAPAARNGMQAGIYHAELDTRRGVLSAPRPVASISGAGFLAMHPSGDFLYSLGGLPEQGTSGRGNISAFRVVAGGESAELELLNSVSTGDGGAAHLAVDHSGTRLLSAQYGGGSTSLYRIAEDGSIKSRDAMVKHVGGSGVVPRRQDSPHAHWAGFSPDDRFAFVPDLGMDKVVIWDVSEPGRLKPHGHGKCIPGGGPRHMKFAPDGDRIYVLNELDLSVTTFDYDAGAGTMTPTATVRTLSPATKSKETFNSASEIRIHPSGNFLYTGNRGHDSVTVFRLDSGALTPVEAEPIRGAWPRNFDLDPTGKWLIAAGQQSNTLTVFSIDPDTGELTFTRQTQFAPGPICVLIR